MHISQRLTLTARRSSRFRGQPARIEIFGRFCKKLIIIRDVDFDKKSVLEQKIMIF